MTSERSPEVRVDVFQLSQEVIDELLAQRLLARLATREPDGNVHIVPMWYLHEDDSLFIPTSRFTRKIRHLEAHSYAWVVVDQYREGEAVRGVHVDGPVEIIGGEAARSMNTRIHQRYVEAAALESGALAQYLTGDDVTIRIAMERVRSWKVAADPDDRSPFKSFRALDF